MNFLREEFLALTRKGRLQTLPLVLRLNVVELSVAGDRLEHHDATCAERLLHSVNSSLGYS